MVIESKNEQTLEWSFPLPRTHTGVHIANGIQGILVWGDQSLTITVGRAGFWDHRSGNDFSSRISFPKLREMLYSGNEKLVSEIFRDRGKSPGLPESPRQIGCGRIEIEFPGQMLPTRASLNLQTASLSIELEDRLAGATNTIVVRQSVTEEVFWIDLPDDLVGRLSVHALPTWHFVGQELAAVGCVPPEVWADDAGGGFCQYLPQDPALALAWCYRGQQIVVATALGDAPTSVAIDAAKSSNTALLATASEQWWADYWQSVPHIKLPDSDFVRMHTYGLFKLAGLTMPQGIPATLQGAWMEDYQLPLWSNDYHFNINLQLIYWPLLSSNRLSHFDPLWRMIRNWMPKLARNAEGFFEVPGGLMLPHAVDDRCQAVGDFWHGTIDHASTAWMAQLAWLHYSYSGDMKHLSDVAWPLLNGAFNGFWSMLEEVNGEAGAKRLSLPVSVSPEYGEGAEGTWGRDASFQLAAMHCVARLLPQAASVLDEPIDARWAQVTADMPLCSVVPVPRSEWDSPDAPDRFRIALWEGQDLEFSHRHHSHLAGIYPFDIFDHANAYQLDVIDQTLEHWRTKGAGSWCAWCLPWASIICARSNRVNAAVAWLRWLIETHENEGGNLTAGGHRGAIASWGGADEALGAPGKNEVMQLDANIGIISAIHELLVRSRGKTIDVLSSIPYRWGEVDFDGILTAGGFVVGGTVRNGHIAEIRIDCLRGGDLHVVHGIGGNWALNGNSAPRTGDLNLTTLAGDVIKISPISE